MSRFHISISNLLDKVPPLPHGQYYFYLREPHRELQRQIERITQDIVILTFRTNRDVIDVICEYQSPEGYDEEAHERALELVKGKYFFYYPHENPEIRAPRSFLHYIENPRCRQVYLYAMNHAAPDVGYLILAPPDENVINPAYTAIGTPIVDNATCHVYFTYPTQHEIYIDLTNMGHKRSVIEQRNELITTNVQTPATLPQKRTAYMFYAMEKYWKEYQEEHPNIQPTNEKVIIQFKYDALEKNDNTWRRRLADLPRVIHKQIVINENQKDIITTYIPPPIYDNGIVTPTGISLRIQQETAEQPSQPQQILTVRLRPIPYDSGTLQN